MSKTSKMSSMSMMPWLGLGGPDKWTSIRKKKGGLSALPSLNVAIGATKVIVGVRGLLQRLLEARTCYESCTLECRHWILQDSRTNNTLVRSFTANGCEAYMRDFGGSRV